MILRLYAAGSNACGQLASADCDDQHQLYPSRFALADQSISPANAILPSCSMPPGTTRVLSLACGSNHTLLLLERAHSHINNPSQHNESGFKPNLDPELELWGCGDSTRGQLPGLSLGSTQVFQRLSCDLSRWGLSEYKIAGIAACWETSFVILTPTAQTGETSSDDPESVRSKPKSDVMISFGANDFGDRGVGPSPASDGAVIDFSGIKVSGASLSTPPYLVRVRDLTTGPHHVVAALDIWPTQQDTEPVSALVGWGACRHGQLGTITKPPATKPKGPPRPGSQATQMVDKPVVIATYRDEVSRPCHLAAGSQHTLVLHNSGRVTTLGSSRRGQLDMPQSTTSAREIGCNWTSSFVVSHSDSGSDWCIEACGNSNHGQLGRGPNESATFGPVSFPSSFASTIFRRLACGSEHSLVLVGEEVWAWGWNEHGNIGVGHTDDVLAPVRVWPFDGVDTARERVVQVWAGCGTSWILIESEDVSESSNSRV